MGLRRPYAARIANAQSVKERAGAVAPESGRCAVFGCVRPTQQAIGRGLSGVFCRYHIDKRARHGSTWKKSYTAAEVRPYRHAAAKWIAAAKLRSETDEASPAESRVPMVLTGLNSMLAGAGPVVPAMSLNGLPAERRAHIAIARLRERGVSPESILAVHLGVMAALEEDPIQDRSEDFRLTQIGKAIHRLASGTHRVWEVDGVVVARIDKWPASRGAVLRRIGRLIDETAGILGGEAVDAVVALKVARRGAHPLKAATMRESMPEAQAMSGQQRLTEQLKAMAEHRDRAVHAFIATTTIGTRQEDLQVAGFGIVAVHQGTVRDFRGGGGVSSADHAIAEAIALLGESFPHDRHFSVTLSDRGFRYRIAATTMFAGAARRNHIARLRKRFEAAMVRTRWRDLPNPRRLPRELTRAVTLALEAASIAGLMHLRRKMVEIEAAAEEDGGGLRLPVGPAAE